MAIPVNIAIGCFAILGVGLGLLLLSSRFPRRVAGFLFVLAVLACVAFPAVAQLSINATIKEMGLGSGVELIFLPGCLMFQAPLGAEHTIVFAAVDLLLLWGKKLFCSFPLLAPVVAPPPRHMASPGEGWC